MYTFEVENAKGERLELSHNPNYSIVSIHGLTPAAALINTSTMGNFDGAKYNSSRVGTRNIVIQLHLERDIEANRIMLYTYFRPKQWCRLYFKNTSRSVYIDGYVETFDGDLFVLGQRMQISVICPQPYFMLADGATYRITRTASLFEFPFAIDAEGIPFSGIEASKTAVIMNRGDVDIGLKIELQADGGNVVNPILYNADNGDTFPLHMTILDGDTVTINTNRGEKRIELTRDGATSNIISQITSQVDWFQIPTGQTVFTFACDSGQEFLNVDFYINEKFQGV